MPGKRLLDVAAAWFLNAGVTGVLNWPVNTALGAEIAAGHIECSDASCVRAHRKKANRHETASQCVCLPARITLPVENTSSFPWSVVLNRMWENGDSGSSADSCLNTGSCGICSWAGNPSNFDRRYNFAPPAQLLCSTTFARFKYLMRALLAFHLAGFAVQS